MRIGEHNPRRPVPTLAVRFLPGLYQHPARGRPECRDERWNGRRSAIARRRLMNSHWNSGVGMQTAHPESLISHDRRGWRIHFAECLGFHLRRSVRYLSDLLQSLFGRRLGQQKESYKAPEENSVSNSDKVREVGAEHIAWFPPVHQ